MVRTPSKNKPSDNLQIFAFETAQTSFLLFFLAYSKANFAIFSDASLVINFTLSAWSD